MFSKSLTARFIFFLFETFKNSFLFGLIEKIGSFVGRIYKSIRKIFVTSISFKVFVGLFTFFKKSYQNTFLRKYINSNPCCSKSWEESLIAKIMDSITGFIFCIIRKCGDGILKNESSFIVRGFLSFTKKVPYHIAFAVITSLMFLVYASFWNNLFAAAIAGVFIVVLIYNYRELKFSRMDFFCFLFIISIFMGMFFSPTRGDSARIAIIDFTGLGFLLCSAKTLDNEKKIGDFVKIISVMVFVSAIIAIIQRIMGIEVDALLVDTAENSEMPGRAFSTMENPNNYAELLVLFLPFLLAVFVNEKKTGLKCIWGLMGVVSIVGLALTYSRSSYIGFVIAILVFVLVYDYRWMLPIAICGILAIPFLPQSIINRIMTIGSTADSSNTYRLYIWDSCIRLVKRYAIPGLGLGPDAFLLYYKPLADKHAMTAPHSHMLYFEVLLEYGLLGFVGFFAFYIRKIRLGFKAVSFCNKEQKAYLGAALGALLGISFVCMAEYVWFYPRDLFAHMIVIGILSALTKNILNKETGNI